VQIIPSSREPGFACCHCRASGHGRYYCYRMSILQRSSFSAVMENVGVLYVQERAMLNVVKPTQEQWAVLQELGLTEPGSAVVLVSPELEGTMPLPDEIDYDFGSDADVWV